jgi:hypothetical protein
MRWNVVGNSDAAGPVKTEIGENFVDPGGGIRIDVAIQLEPTQHFRALRDKHVIVSVLNPP